MIIPREPQTAEDVASHYDELDGIYRALWGEHVHHGYWASGHETPGEAVDALADLVADRLELGPGERLVDIGCGYGATAARLARMHGVHVTGLTLSAEQAKVATARPGALGFEVRDWLDNGLPDAAFDRAYAIESSEHMVDKPLFFAEAARVLRPGGRLVVCAWLAAADASQWQVDHLLEPICREGRLPSMGTHAEYAAMAEEAGFRSAGYEDISRRVQRTWTLCLGRFLGALATDPATRKFVLRASRRNRAFALSVPRLILAYRTGAMRYGVFRFDRI